MNVHADKPDAGGKVESIVIIAVCGFYIKLMEGGGCLLDYIPTL